MSPTPMPDEPEPLPQLDDMLGAKPKNLRVAAELMKLVDEEIREGEDWGEMAGFREELKALRERLLRAAKLGEKRKSP